MVCAGMHEDQEECAITTIPNDIVDMLVQLNVSLVGDERPNGLALPFAHSRIQYGDQPWKILKDWAIDSNFEHSVRIIH